MVSDFDLRPLVGGIVPRQSRGLRVAAGPVVIFENRVDRFALFRWGTVTPNVIASIERKLMRTSVCFLGWDMLAILLDLVGRCERS